MLPTIQDEKPVKINEKLSRIKYKIAVFSGKGGVGKTTVSVNLACALEKAGYSVGIMDADIDCPNVGKLLGMDEKFSMAEKRLEPKEKYGIKIVSMALFSEDEKPIIWRGPMIHNALVQLMELSDYGDLDYLIIDMPPGTSDAALTAMQLMPLDLVIILTTSSKLSLMDARKAAIMAKDFNKQPCIIENMSGDIFGEGQGKKLAAELKAPFIASIRMSKETARAEEEGIPIVLKSSETAKCYEDIIRGINTILRK